MFPVVSALLITVTSSAVALQAYAFGCEHGWKGLVAAPLFQSELASILLLSLPSAALCATFIMLAKAIRNGVSANLVSGICGVFVAWTVYTFALAWAATMLARSCYFDETSPGETALIYLVLIPGAIVAVLAGLSGAAIGKIAGNRYLRRR